MLLISLTLMQSVSRPLLCACLMCSFTATACFAQKSETAAVPADAIAEARTATYCEIQEHPDRFRNTIIRVRGLYETDFEKSEMSVPSCPSPISTTWISFDKQWESRTARKARRSLSSAKWGGQMDVVFVGLFKSDGRYGHMDMYPFSIEVYKVEAVRASGNFRPLP